MHRTKLIAILTAVAALPTLFAATSHAQATLADKAVTKILGHWEANDMRKKGRVVKFYIQNGNPSFEDWIEHGVSLTGSVRQDNNGGDYVLRYATGYECRYTVSYAAGHADGDRITFHLVNAKKPNEDVRFSCFEGRLERIQRKIN